VTVIAGSIADILFVVNLDTMARILLLIPSRTYRTHDFMDAAARLGIEVVVGSEHRPALAGLMQDRHLRLDFHDVERSTARIVEYAGRHPLSAVVAADDSGTVLAAAAADALGLPHNPVEAVQAARDKAQMRDRFQAAGLATPRFAIVGLDEDPATVAGTLRFPAVVKPVDLSGSQGVIKVDDAAGFPAVFRRVAAIVAACQPNGGQAALLVEDFIPGDEVAVEALLRRGELEVLAIFDKPDPLNGPYFEETIYVTPSRLDGETQSRVIETTGRAARALGLRDGPIHAELRLNSDGVWMLELAARSIGGLCSRTLRFGSGVSLEELILRHAAGLPLPPHHREGLAAGVMMLPIPTAGRLRAVDGQAEAKQVPGVDGLVITIPPNETLTPLPEGDRYLGFMFARAETPAAVEAGLRQAHARLRVVVDA
jgi:biotin carboxylase